MLKNIILTIILCCSVFESAVAQTNTNKGTDFWVGNMLDKLAIYGPNNDYSSNPFGVVISSNKAVSGVISASDGWSKSFNISVNGLIKIEIPLRYCNSVGTGVFSNGIHIVTSDTVWVTSFQGDVTMVLPTPSLGNEYIVNTYAENGYEEFVVVAIKDGTIIEVTPPDSTAYIVHLNKGDVYQKMKWIQSGTLGVGHISGYRIKEITCNKKIAVFAGSPSSDLNGSINYVTQMVEQMPPLYSLGNEFIAVSPVPFMISNHNIWFDHSFYSIVAVENNTTINLNGELIVLNAGETYRENIYKDLYLKADKPVSVTQICGGIPLLGDPTDDSQVNPYMTMVSSVDHEIYDHYIQRYRGNNNNLGSRPYIVVVVKTINKSSVYIDGEQINSNLFVTTVNNPSYSFVQIELNNAKDKFHIYSLEGFTAYFIDGPGVPVGYTLGFGYPFSKYEQKPSFSLTYAGNTTNYKDFNQVVCSCEPIGLSVDNPFSELIYKWKLTDTTFVYGETISHHYLNGDYNITLYALNKDNCVLNQVTMEHLIVENCDITMSPNRSACAEDTTVLSVNAGSTFLWNTGESTQSIKVSPDKTTLYTVSVDGGAANICDSIFVYVKGSRPVVNLGPSQTICDGVSIKLNAAYDQATYLWQDNSTQSTYTVTKEGMYYVTSTNLCGMDRDSIDIFVIKPPKFDLGKDVGICLEQQVEICVNVEADSYKWNTGSTDSCIIVTQPGQYVATALNRCFTRKDAITVNHAVCKELIFYNLITPNKDGKNDFFVVENINERDCTLRIFNRWGNKVYEKDHYNNEWDATGISDGVYYYQLDDHTTQSKFKGWVEVLANTSK